MELEPQQKRDGTWERRSDPNACCSSLHRGEQQVAERHTAPQPEHTAKAQPTEPTAGSEGAGRKGRLTCTHAFYDLKNNAARRPPQLVQMTFSLYRYRRDGTIRTSPEYLQAKGRRAQVMVSSVCHHQTSIKQPTSAGEKGSPVLKSSSVSDLPLEIHFMNFLQF